MSETRHMPHIFPSREKNKLGLEEHGKRASKKTNFIGDRWIVSHNVWYELLERRPIHSVHLGAE